MGDLVLKGATSGQITVTPTAIAGTNTLTLPAKTGNIITSADSGTVTQAMIQNGNSSTPLPGIGATGPAFSAYQSSAQTVSSATFTKVQFQSEEFDTNNNFDSSTNYRFQPTVAGYYQVVGAVAVGASSTTGLISIYKGTAPSAPTEFKRLGYNTATSAFNQTVGSALVYLNGTTNYIELYCFIATGQALFNDSSQTYFQASLVRAA